MREMLSSNGH